LCACLPERQELVQSVAPSARSAISRLTRSAKTGTRLSLLRFDVRRAARQFPPVDNPSLNWAGPPTKVACLFPIAIKGSIIVCPLLINFHGFGLSAWRPFVDVPSWAKKRQPTSGARNQVDETFVTVDETIVTVKDLDQWVPLLRSRACPKPPFEWTDASIHVNFKDANKIGVCKNSRQPENAVMQRVSYLIGAVDI
jgi:hypothetical protein